MDPPDFAALVAALQEEHDIDEDSATEMAHAVTGALRSVFEKAGSVLSTKGMDPEEAPRVLTADHLRFALQPYTSTLGPLSMLPSRIVADGDGNCLLTTLALDMELKVSCPRTCPPPLSASPQSHAASKSPVFPAQRGVALARTCLEEGRKPTEDEGVPYLDGNSGETAWLDGVELRKTFARFYGPDRIHRLLPESFGNVTWQEKVRNEDGSETTVTKERRMTRCDMICTEVQTMRHTMEIDFSPCDAALAKRLAIASHYVQDISKHGVWCSAPSIVAFSIARLEKRIHRLLPESFGNVTWQEKVRNEDGSETTVTKERRMTRCDMICTEVQTMRHTMEIDFSPCDAALAKRLAIASHYVQDISKHGVWCSAPSIVAFSIARLEKRPVRVYYCSGSSLYVYADTVPDGALPPPPAHLDEFLLDFEDASASKALVDDDDLHAFVPKGLASPMDTSSSSSAAAGGGAAAAGDDEEDEDAEEDPDPETYTQDVTRILFNGGHYDLAVTASERLALLRVFPNLAAHFQRFPSSLKPTSGGKK